MNWGLFFGSLIVVYLVSYFWGYNNGSKDAEDIMRETEHLKKFEGEDTE